MAIAAPTTPFVWGAGGSMKTPEQIAREREIAAALLQGGVDYSPVDHWLQGAARAAQAGVGALKGRWADEAENAGRGGFQSRWDSVFGGGAAPVAADPVAAALVAPQTAVGATAAMAGDSPLAAYLAADKDHSHVAGLDGGFSSALAQFLADAPGGGITINSGYRSPERQAQLWEEALAKYGSEEEARKWVAPPGRSNHNHGTAADLAYASDEARAWAHENAARYGLNFRLSHEPWHIEFGGAPSGGAATARVAQAGGMGGSPDIASLLGLASDPWANDTQRSIINSLVGQQLQQQDPAYQLDLALKQAQLDAALNPVVEAPKPIEVGGVLLDPVTYQPIFDSRQGEGQFRTLTSEEAAALGLNPGNVYQQGPDGKISDVGGSLVTVNTGGEVGTIPPGYELVNDPVTGARRLQLIEGGPAWQEAQAAAAAAQAGDDQTSRYGNVVVEDIGRALELVENDPTFSTGIFGQALKGISGTPANRLENLLNTVRANSAFDRLQAMRAASPTGGALGAVSERELTLLQSAIGSLETGDPKDLAHNLRRLQTIYNEIIHGPQGAPVNSGPAAPAGQSQLPRVTTQQEYDALPPGPYLAPDGTIRTKR